MGRYQTGLAVQLLYRPSTDETYVTVVDGENEPITREFPQSVALDAYHHPACHGLL
jgi:hypothetical protein